MLRHGVAVLAVLAWMLPALPASAAPLPGFDLFETDPGSTQFTFQEPGTAIPPGFFGPGSDPFTEQVHFGGVPLGTFQGQRIGDADTVVQRHVPPPSAPPDAVPIELVQLSLRSVDPITVTYNRGQSPERWNVDVSPSPSAKSQGVIFIQKDAFDSQLLVIPLLSFTRLSDGEQRSLDMGSLPPTVQDGLIFQQENAPWRQGCLLPALAVPGLNDDFCPGLTPEGEKVLTVEQALFASHGIYPVQPSLEHFQCYTTQRRPFRARTVGLGDQFGRRKARVARRAELCNPVRKNKEPFLNRRAHLQCYATRGPALEKLVAVQNQLGSQRLLVGAPRRLCLPTEKRVLRRRKSGRFARIQVPIDHFQCYAVRPQGPLLAARQVRSVRLSDQFGRRGTRLGRPFQLCAPVRKRWKGRVTPLQHPVKHLVCYLTEQRKVRRLVRIRNQFERRILPTRKAVALCIPSNKLVL